MKKGFLFLIVSVLLLGCSQKENEPEVVKENESEAVVWTETKAMGQMESPYNDSLYVTDSVIVNAKLSKQDTTLTLTVNNVRFVPQQPMLLTFSLTGIKYRQEEENVISFAADSVVPISGVMPMPTYMARGLQGKITADSLIFKSSFAENYSCTYRGKIVKI